MVSGESPSKVISGIKTDTGKVRQHNEDSVLRLEFTLTHDRSVIYAGFYAVADGIGGHECGEVASQMALEIIANHITESIMRSYSRLPHSTNLPQATVMKKLSDGMRKANKKVYVAAQSKGNMMGTTLSAALIIDGSVYISNVGDSRVYLLHKDSLRQITTDHSYVAELVAAGRITREDIYTHPNRNIITRYVGMDEDVPPDLFVIKLEPGDSLFLCTDGLWEMIRDEAIASVIKESPDPQTACDRLVEIANQNGGIDNISAVVVKICP